ncbi:MoaF C-terminal domain-containing protein [Geodermatophilus sp. SYSU D01186]
MTIPTTTAFSWDKNDWTALSDMAEGFDEYRPPLSAGLEGQTLTLRCRVPEVTGSDHTLVHDFGARELRWTLLDGDGRHEGSAPYELFEMQPGLFFLHYLRDGGDHPVAVSLALDTTTGQATGAIGELGLQPEPHRARQTWFQGWTGVADTAVAIPHPATTELIGHRIRYAYSSDDVYDHVYLNEHLFTWICVGGAEAGLGDTDHCTHWKLRDRTYLFSWLEKNVGVEGMVLIDLTALRTVGIQFGLDQKTGELVNITMGAYAIDLGRAPGIDSCRPGPA